VVKVTGDDEIEKFSSDFPDIEVPVSAASIAALLRRRRCLNLVVFSRRRSLHPCSSSPYSGPRGRNPLSTRRPRFSPSSWMRTSRRSSSAQLSSSVRPFLSFLTSTLQGLA
jgi:hypothetical protein